MPRPTSSSPSNDGADRDEYRAGEQLTEDDADREPDGLEPAAAHHRDRRGEAEWAQGRDHGVGDQVNGRAQHEYATPSRRLNASRRPRSHFNAIIRAA
jgi:hypothetical protein